MNISKQIIHFIFYLGLVGLLLSFKSKDVIKIKYNTASTTLVPEPSDACLSPDGTSLFMVSDNGYLFETDLTGKILRKSAIQGVDFEAICLANNLLYLSDESTRKVYCVNPKDLSLKQIFSLNYNAARNSGFEAIAYNEKERIFYLISEKNPTIIRVYNEEFQLLNEVDFNEAADVSSAMYYRNNLWLLSDEEHVLMQLDDMFKVVKKYDFKILNPEGFFFNKDGKLTVVSDDMAKLYQFEAGELK